MNAAALAKRLLVYSDQRTLSEANTAGVEYLESAVDAINQAAQQLYLLGPAWMSTRDYGLAVRPPLDVVTVIQQYSADAVIITLQNTSIPSAYVGCCMRGADGLYNRILSTSNSPTYTAAKMQNQQAVAISGSATIYHDALRLPGEIVSVLPGVTLDDNYRLRPATTESDLYSNSGYERDYGRTFASTWRTRPPEPGQPSSYFITSISPEIDPVGSITAAQTALFMRICPYPTEGHTIRFRAKIRPPAITVLHLDASNNGAASTQQIPLPNGWDELYLLPIAKQIFTGSPFFNNTSQLPEIQRAYELALRALREAHPQTDHPLYFTPTV